jgi:CheY-like chemotaxis protein
MQLTSASNLAEDLATQAVTSLRILFVDDDDTIREAMVAILNWFGHDTFSAARGRAALNLYRTNDVDLVITDYEMPDMKGFDLARRIREINPSAKIIMLTGLDNATNEENSEYVDCVLKKPATMQIVIDTIQDLFRGN